VCPHPDCFFQHDGGYDQVSAWEILELLKGNVEGELINQIIVNVRMPRIMTGVLVGMNLAVAGVLLQGLIRNPMASPNIIGVNAGAGLAAVIIMALLPERIEVYRLPLLSVPWRPLFSSICSQARQARDRIVHVALAGVAVSNLLRAITSGLMMIHSDILDVTYSWLMGSLSGRSWTAFQTILPYSLVATDCEFNHKS